MADSPDLDNPIAAFRVAGGVAMPTVLEVRTPRWFGLLPARVDYYVGHARQWRHLRTGLKPGPQLEEWLYERWLDLVLRS